MLHDGVVEGLVAELIEASQSMGWRTFDTACIMAYEQGVITEETAVLYCSKRGPVTRAIDNLKKSRGETTSILNALRMKPVAAAKSEGPAGGGLKLK